MGHIFSSFCIIYIRTYIILYRANSNIQYTYHSIRIDSILIDKCVYYLQVTTACCKMNGL